MCCIRNKPIAKSSVLGSSHTMWRAVIVVCTYLQFIAILVKNPKEHLLQGLINVAQPTQYAQIKKHAKLPTVGKFVHSNNIFQMRS